MQRIVMSGLLAGILLAVMDALYFGNPLAARLLEAYTPLARPAVDPMASSLVNLAYGVFLAALYHRLQPSLPGRSSIGQGLAFGAGIWVLRTVMDVAGRWVMTTLPPATLGYLLFVGLVELLLSGMTLGLLLHSLPQAHRVRPALLSPQFRAHSHH